MREFTKSRMRTSAWGLAALIALSGMTVTYAEAQAPSVENMSVDLFLKDADLTAATQMVTMKTGLQFVLKPSDKPFDKITLRLEGATPADAIRYICQAAGAYFMRDESGVFIISREPFAAEKVESSTPATPKKAEVLKRITLVKGDARVVYEQIVFGAVADSNRPWMELKKFGRIASSDMAGYINHMNYAKDGLANQRTFSAGVSEQRAMPMNGNEASNDILLPGEESNQVGRGGGGGLGGGIGGGGFGGGQGGLGGGGLGGGGLGQGGGGLGGGGLGQGGGAQWEAGQGLVPEGIDYISYDPTDNSLIVRGDTEAINTLQSRIALFDVAPKQVTIKVEFITVSSSVARSLGFDWLIERGTVFAGNRPGSFVRASDPIFLNYATGNVTSRMRTLLTNGYGRTVQSPILRTLNNQPAVIFSNITTTFFVGQSGGTGGTVFTTYVPQQQVVSTNLAVTPRINADGYITMFLQPQVSDLGQTRRSPDGQEIPDILQQALSVVARVKNNETIVLGGFVRKNETGSQSRYPILGDLPIIGQFFRSTNRDVNNSELLIFFTPSVIEDDASVINP